MRSAAGRSIWSSTLLSTRLHNTTILRCEGLRFEQCALYHDHGRGQSGDGGDRSTAKDRDECSVSTGLSPRLRTVGPVNPAPKRRCEIKVLLLLASCLSISSCVYFNTFYNAKKYYRQAEKERRQCRECSPMILPTDKMFFTLKYPMYFRTDISLTKGGKLFKKPAQWKFQIINLTNNFNVLFYNWNHYSSPSKVSAVSMFPFILTFGVSLEL